MLFFENGLESNPFVVGGIFNFVLRLTRKWDPLSDKGNKTVLCNSPHGCLMPKFWLESLKTCKIYMDNM